MKKFTFLLVMLAAFSLDAYRPKGHVPPNLMEAPAISILLKGTEPVSKDTGPASCDFEFTISDDMAEEPPETTDYGAEFTGLMARYHYWRNKKKSGVDIWETKVTNKCVSVTYCVRDLAIKDIILIDAVACPPPKD